MANFRGCESLRFEIVNIIMTEDRNKAGGCNEAGSDVLAYQAIDLEGNRPNVAQKCSAELAARHKAFEMVIKRTS
jgi:hypothetical protein